MAESSQPSERPPKDPIRIVYHAQNRTFARLFKERSLDQVKDVVRHKLGLGPELDVTLKQMGPDALLDLDDDDDFQAFRVLVGSSVSVDIQVIVGRSQRVSAPPPVAPQPREQPSVAAPPITLPSSSSKKSSSQATARPEAASIAGPSTGTKRTPEPSARKRKVSFGDTAVATPDKPTERRAQPKPVAATPVSSPKTAETPAATKSTDAEGPLKKKQKKDIVKAKGAQPTGGVESPSTKASAARNPKVKKSAALDRGTEVATSVSKDGEPSELPAKKSGKRKKDDVALPKKSSGPPDGMDQPISQPNPINDTSVQLSPERRIGSGAEGGILKTRQSKKKIGACAAIPRTSASTNVQSEVAAAILSSCLSKASEAVPPPPPAKRKSLKRDTKESSASSSALLSRSTAANASSSGTPNLPTEPRHEQAVATNESPPQTREPNGPLCPICLGEPFHIRYRCPTVLKGPDAIRKRLEEVKESNVGDQQSLIKELEGLLRDTEVTSESPSNATPPHEVQSQEALQPLNASVPRTPNIPSNSNLSEVTVESRDEGSSSESSDDMSEGRNKHNKELSAPVKRKTPDKQLSPSNDDLEAVIRGPALRRQSILHVLDRIVDDEDNKGSESEEDEVELEEDSGEEINRSSSRLSKPIMSSSDSETEEEESMSPSPSLPAKDNPGATIQGLSSSVEKSTEHPGHDVVMGNCVDPPVLRGRDDDSSEETHVGSEDRMVVDNTVGENGVATIVEEQLFSPPSKAPFPEPSGEPNNEPQGSGETEVDPTANGDGRAPTTSKVPGEAEADPIEPADDLEPATTSRTSNSDPIEALLEDTGSLFTGIDQSTLKPGVTKRIKTRDGRILDDEAEHPILLGQLATSISEEVTPLPTKGKPRRKVTETPASQEQVLTRRRTRSSSLLPSTSTPAAVTLLSHRIGARSAKTPAKRSEQRTDGSQISTKNDRARNAALVAPSPSLVNWETLAEPVSPSQQLDEPSVHIDELMSSPPEDNAILGRLNAQSTPALGKGRLFDLSSSQIPFPYSQHKANPASTFPNGKKEAATDSDSEQEAKATKRKSKPSAYRPLSQLASQAVLFSPSLPTPINKFVAGTKTKKHAADKDSSSSSSDEDEDEANKSVHIPRGRRAGAKLETRKRKSLLSRV